MKLKTKLSPLGHDSRVALNRRLNCSFTVRRRNFPFPEKLMKALIGTLVLVLIGTAVVSAQWKKGDKRIEILRIENL